MNRRQLDLRLARAELHVDALEKAHGHFRSKLKRYRLVTEVHSDELEQTTRIRMDWEVPEDWGIRVGEVLHQLRAVLDNLAWQQVTATGRTPSRNTAFLVEQTQAKFESRRDAQFKGADPAFLAAMERAQPCSVPDATFHPLRLLVELNNADKHRAVAVAAALASVTEITITDKHGAAEATLHSVLQPLYDGAVVSRVTFARPCTEAVHVELGAPLEVVIVNPRGNPPFIPVPRWLREVHAAVKDVVDWST